MRTSAPQSRSALAEVLRPTASGYALALFRDEEIHSLNLFEKRGAWYLRCVLSGKERSAKPEEIVRQLFLLKLIREYGYPKERIFLNAGTTVHEVHGVFNRRETRE